MQYLENQSSMGRIQIDDDTLSTCQRANDSGITRQGGQPVQIIKYKQLSKVKHVIINKGYNTTKTILDICQVAHQFTQET
jgi:hypothetical protein